METALPETGKRRRGRPRKSHESGENPPRTGGAGRVRFINPRLRPVITVSISPDRLPIAERLAGKSSRMGKTLSLTAWASAVVTHAIDEREIFEEYPVKFSGLLLGTHKTFVSDRFTGFCLGDALGTISLMIAFSTNDDRQLDAIQSIELSPLFKRFVIENASDLREIVMLLAAEPYDEVNTGLVTSWFNAQPELTACGAWSTLGRLWFQSWNLGK